jgi:hypothetical protein
MKRLTAVGPLAALCLVSLLIAACGGVQAEDDGINAAQAGAIEMGIDPETTGNTASSLGTLESCVRIDVPNPAFDDVSDYNVDVYVRGDTQAPIAYDAALVYSAFNDGCPALDAPETGDACLNSVDDDGDGMINDGCPQVGATAESGLQCAPGVEGTRTDDDGDAIVHVADPGTDQLIKMPGATAFAPDSDTDGEFNAGAAYISGGSGIAGDGVILRVGLDIGGSGLVAFALNPSPGTAYASAAGEHPITLVAARLAINQDCPGVTPTATSTATPTATPTSTSTPGTPTPTPPPGTVLLVSGWNNSCYVGPEQLIDDALAGVAENVLAAYRMRADQGFDRWFPNRPDVSTIASLSPYQSLFILTDQSAAWVQVQQLSGMPPASTSLANGWNSVCYTGGTKSTEEATAGVAGGLAIMYQLASDQSWSRYAPDRPDVSNLVQLSQFGAVLVLVNQEGGTSWTFDP